jgi:hypothetical protein
LSCGHVAWQRPQNARQRHCRVSTHDNAMPGNAHFAVRLATNGRQRLCRAHQTLPCVLFLCRAGSICCASALCRALRSLYRAIFSTMPSTFAVCPPAPLCRAPCTSTHGKGPGSTLARPPNAQVCATCRLCRVYVHGNVTKWSFAVCIHTAKPHMIFCFFVFR